ncbi:MAG: hypothetical protein OEQ47_18870 [Acidimicrobiia bacterium]|nr:hypothetical protein [Acidimicrobiia bacterium]
MPDEQNETLEYLRSVIGGRTEVEWFTDSVTGSDLVASPMDVFVRTTDGAVTWGWSVQPIPVDPGLRTFRRFRSAESLVILTDAAEPEILFIPHTVELHSISHGRQADFSAGLPSSTVPSASVAFDLEKAARSSEGRYSIDPAFPHETISAALELWTASMLEEGVTFSWSPLSQDEEREIDELTGGEDVDEGFEGFDAEIADILSDFESIAWFQADLTWPDADNTEAFRDHVDVRFRSPSEGLVYLASIGPLGSGDDPWVTTTDRGGLMSLDRSDPTVIGLAPDRLVIALSRPADGYEPAGIATPWGVPPATEDWAELRTFGIQYPSAVMVSAPGWSEGRVADALTTWARYWSDLDVEFGYDYDDPIPQATIEANEALAEAESVSNEFVRTATQNRCVHSDAGTAPNEVPFPCGRTAAFYYTPGDSSEGVVLVCEEHVPPDVSASPLLK